MGNFSPLLTIVGKEDLSSNFPRHCHLYQNKFRKELKENIISNYLDFVTLILKSFVKPSGIHIITKKINAKR
jgi:hypothetical protein